IPGDTSGLASPPAPWRLALQAPPLVLEQRWEGPPRQDGPLLSQAACRPGLLRHPPSRSVPWDRSPSAALNRGQPARPCAGPVDLQRSEEHTSELQSRENLVCRLL